MVASELKTYASVRLNKSQTAAGRYGYSTSVPIRRFPTPLMTYIYYNAPLFFSYSYFPSEGHRGFLTRWLFNVDTSLPLIVFCTFSTIPYFLF